MGVEQFDFALHARALVEGRAVRAAQRARVDLREDAVFVAVLAMHGEPALLWGVGVGRMNDAKPRQVHVALDPRRFDEQLQVWAALGRGFRSTFGDPQTKPDSWFPQVCVATVAAWRHLHAGAERFYTVDDHNARHAAETILWLAERYEHAGNQAIVVLAELLADHYATGQPDEEDRLDVWCKWLGVPDNRTYDKLDDTAPASLEPSAARKVTADGVDEVRTHPQWDETPLFGPAKSYGYKRSEGKKSIHGVLLTARRTDEDKKPQAAQSITRWVTPKLSGAVEARFSRLVRLYARIRNDFPDLLEGLAEFADEDARSWQRWRQSRDNGYYATRRDGVLVATLGLMSREQAADAWDRLLVAHDDIAFRRAVHDGRGIIGTVRSVADRRVQVVTSQPIVRARPGSELVMRGTDTPVMVVDDLWTEGQDTVLLLDCLTGDNQPTDGDDLVLVAAPFDWGRAVRSRTAAVRRLKEPPWTHQAPEQAPAPRHRAVTVPDDLYDRVMARRA